MGLRIREILTAIPNIRIKFSLRFRFLQALQGEHSLDVYKRQHFYWPAIKRYYWNLLFSIPLLAHLYISEPVSYTHLTRIK